MRQIKFILNVSILYVCSQCVYVRTLVRVLCVWTLGMHRGQTHQLLPEYKESNGGSIRKLTSQYCWHHVILHNLLHTLLTNRRTECMIPSVYLCFDI